MVVNLLKILFIAKCLLAEPSASETNESGLSVANLIPTDPFKHSGVSYSGQILPPMAYFASSIELDPSTYHFHEARMLAGETAAPAKDTHTIHYFEANGLKRNEKVYNKPTDLAEFNTTTQRIEMGKAYKFAAETPTFELAANSTVNDTLTSNSDMHYAIEVFGQGKLLLEIFSSLTNLTAANKTKIIDIDPSMNPLLILVDTKYLSTAGSGFTIRNTQVPDGDFWYLRLVRMSSLDITFNNRAHINAAFSDAFHFKVVFPENWTDNSPDNRIQFMLHTSLESQSLQGDEFIAMYINKALPFPTKVSSDINAVGIFEGGIVKTISQKNKLFCIEQACAFYLTISSEGIDSYTLFPTITRNGATLSLSEGVSMIEELEPGEEIIYEMDLPSRKGVWVFSIYPTENEIELLLNPDTKPNSIAEYRFINSAKTPQEIVITNEEAAHFNYTMTKFFVKYRCVDENMTATFKFDVQHLDDSADVRSLRPDVAETGIAFVSETVQYRLDLASEIPEIASVSLRLGSTEGKANIYFKECNPSVKSPCQITPADIQYSKDPSNKSIGKTSEGLIFAFTKGSINELERFKTLDTLELKFNCLNGGDRKLFNNTHPISEKCLFAIAVHNEESLNVLGTYYELMLRMESSHEEIKDRETLSMKVNADEEVNLMLRLRNSDFFGDLKVNFRVVAISGICSLYFSQQNKYPNAENNDQHIDISDENSSFIRTTAYNTSLVVAQAAGTDDAFIYISIHGREFCVFDINAEIHGDQPSSNRTEIIRYNQLYIRTIEETSVSTNGTDTVYSKIFEVKGEADTQGIEAFKDLLITLNSAIAGLRICAQYNTTAFDLSASCHFESRNDYLQFSTQAFSSKDGETFFIAVQKIVPAGTSFTRFPLEFSIILNTSTKQNEFELMQPGKTFFGHVDPFNSINLWVDLSSMVDSAVIFFESDDPLSRVDIYGSAKDLTSTLTILDPFRFGFKITDAAAYKQKYCKEKCEVRGLIYTMGNQISHFALTYTIDRAPIIIREGNLLTVPNNLPLYFIYDFESTVDLNFNFLTDGPSSVVFSKLIKKEAFTRNSDISKEVSEIQFDFKTDIDNSLQIVYPPLMLQKENQSVALFYVEPKFNARELPTKDLISVFESADRAKVYVQSEVLKLEPFNPFKEVVLQGEFKYFSVDIVQPQDFSLILSLLNGQADMYIGKGKNEFPTLKRFWKKTESAHGDSIVIAKDTFANPDAIVGTYMIGVYGKANTIFTVLWLPDFKNLIKVKFQTIIDTKLIKGRNYFFDFYNKQEEFNSLLYIEDSDVEISVLDFDKKQSQDLATMLANEDNYVERFTYLKNQLPREHFTSNDSLYGKHIILRMKALDNDARANLLIYNNKLPINGPANQRFHFVMQRATEEVFLIQLDNAYEDVDIDVKLDFGSIDVAASNTFSGFDTVVKFDKPAQKSFIFDLSQKEQSKDILIFKQLYLRVRSSEISRFSVLVRPKNMFKQMKPLQPEIVYSAPDKETYLYFGIRKEDLPNIKAFEIDLNTVSFFGEKPDLLFLPSSDDDLPSQDSKFLPMPLKDIIERNTGEYRQLLVRPEIQVGNYVLKINKNPNKLPIKISVVINNHKSIESNGLYKGSIPKDRLESNEYSMYIGQPGEFRLVLESCASVAITTATFASPSGVAPLVFNSNLEQGYPYIILDEISGSVKREMKMITYPIRRGIVNSEGMLNFRVAPTSNDSKFAHTDEYYVLMSEFRPQNKELILKDYIEIFTENTEDADKVFGYEFYDNYRKLKVFSKMPGFKPQLLLDYPDLKKALLKFNFYLFSDKDIKEKIATCGLSTMNMIDNIPFTVLKTVDRASIANFTVDKSMVEAVFVENSLEIFKDASDLNILCYISVRFFESEDDEWQVSLDLKFTNVPYFLMLIPNKYLNNFLLVTCAILFFGFMFCLALWALFRCCKSPYSEVLDGIRMKDDVSYIAPSMQSEMSRFSVDI